MFLGTLSTLIPPPTYIMMPSYGVDISDTSLKYICFDNKNKPGLKHQLKDWGEVDIPSGVLARGQVLDPKSLTKVLTEFKAKTNASYIRVSLPEERAYLFETEIKRNTSDKEIRGILEFRLEENVPIPAKEAFFSYDILENETTERTIKVVVAAYARETILAYHEACLAAGLTPIAFEVEAQAMARSVLADSFHDSAMLVDFGKTRTGVGIVHDGVLMYTSTIDFGGNELSASLRKVLGDVPEAELTRIKNTEGLIKGIENSNSYEALISTMSVIKDELVTRVQYWHSRDHDLKRRRIKKIILCGGSSNLKGLPEYFTEAIGITTERGSVWQNAFSTDNFIPPIDLRHSYGYATAIGLALPKII